MEGVLTVFSESNLSSEVVLLPLTTPVCLRISMFLWLLLLVLARSERQMYKGNP